MKKCIKCLELKEEKDFPERKYPNGEIKLRNICRTCRTAQNLEWRHREENLVRVKLTRRKFYQRHRDRVIEEAKARSMANPDWAKIAADNYKRKRPYYDALRTKARRMGKILHVPMDDMGVLEAELMKATPECHYCGVTIEVYHASTNNYRKDFWFQIDRIEPAKGYVVGNVVPACSICNIVKNNWFSESIMKEIGPKYIRPLWDVKE